MEEVAPPLMEIEQEVVSVSMTPTAMGSSAASHGRRKSSTPVLANRVPPPRNEEEWVDFIDK